MSRKITGGLLSLLALAILIMVWWGIVHQANAATLNQAAPSEQPPKQERESDPNAPEISFIDNPTAECVLPEQHTDACFIQWNYLQVSATSPSYIISMTVTIDNRLRAYYGGFFQTSMYVPQQMHTPGFRVACGVAGSSGDPVMGNSYAYVVRARETGGLKAANYGSVTCPADVVPVADVSLGGPAQGKVGVPYAFTGDVSPITATLPIDYLWTVTDQGIVSLTNGLSDSQSFTWNTAGVKQIMLEASNAGGAAAAIRYVTISDYYAYLLAILRNFGTSSSSR